MLVAGCERGTIQAWTKDVLLSIRAGSDTGNRLKAHDGAVLAIAWRGGAVLASAGSDRKIHFWSMVDGKLLNSVADADSQIKALAMSPDGKLLASAGENMTVQLWDVATAKPLAKLVDHKDWVLCLGFSHDSKLLASGDFAGEVRLWDVAAAKKVKELSTKPVPLPKEGADPVPAQAVAFAQHGKLLAVGGADGQVRLFDLPEGKLIRALQGHTSAITDLAWHPGGTLLASASKDRTIRLWKPPDPQPLKVLEGHSAWVEGLTFISEYTRLASVGADQTVRIWDLAEPAKK